MSYNKQIYKKIELDWADFRAMERELIDAKKEGKIALTYLLNKILKQKEELK